MPLGQRRHDLRMSDQEGRTDERALQVLAHLQLDRRNKNLKKKNKNFTIKKIGIEVKLSNYFNNNI